MEVTKIDLKRGLVEVLVRGQTFPLELDKKSDAGNEQLSGPSVRSRLGRHWWGKPKTK